MSLNVGNIIPNEQKTTDPEGDLCGLLAERHTHLSHDQFHFFVVFQLLHSKLKYNFASK